nr:GGDEF domain-containing protein [uncultured Aminipila sp.]
MPDIIILYMTSGILNIIMLLFLLQLVSKNIIMSEIETRSYIITIILAIVVITAELAASIFDIQGSIFRIPNIIANIIGFTASAYIPFILATLYDKELIKKLKYILIPAVFISLLFITSSWTGLMFHLTSDNEYSRGPFFNLYIFVYLYGFILLIHANHKLSLQFTGGDKVYLALLYVIFLIGTSIQIFFPRIHSTWHCITIILVMYYIFQRERQFKYDILTGLLNRAAFETQLNRISKKDSAVILIFDLNDFKEINDKYGHQVGDECIKIVGQIIKSSFQQIGYCYRIGGDEFCVLGHNNDESIIEAGIQAMMVLLEKNREILPNLPHISYGYSLYKKAEGKDIILTFKEADHKMYAYKKQAKEIYE